MSPTLTLPTAAEFGRNLVDGRRRFPAAPYEYEIRNPADSTITTVVPLSSRLDVARAVDAATRAAPGWAADRDRRTESLRRLAEALAHLAPELGALQATETGLDAADSRRAATGLGLLAGHLAGSVPERASGVSGHVLSWGLPLAEVVAAVLPQLAAGRTAVVAPSLRAPLSAVAVGHLATELGFPPGVLNVVQGTGEDVGAALCGTRGLALLHVRGGARTIAQAGRATSTTGVPLRVLRGGGNVAVAGPDADVAALAAAVADATRVHATGGPLGLPTLAVHATVADDVTGAVVAGLREVRPAPLPTETLRRRALDRLTLLRAEGLDPVLSDPLPDDVHHRMGWFMPAAVFRGVTAGEPAGPVVTIRTWSRPGDIAALFPEANHRDGIATLWGTEEVDAALPHSLVVHECGPAEVLGGGRLQAAWTTAGRPR
ncbi:MAG: aldehyde dehydrogenase family protein [Pseudonocardia sp.]